MSPAFCTLLPAWSLAASFWNCPSANAAKPSTTSRLSRTSTSSKRVSSASSTAQITLTSSSISSVRLTSSSILSSSTNAASSSVLSSSASVSSAEFVSSSVQPTISLTETIPEVTTATGTTTAANPPASITSSNAATKVSLTSVAPAATGSVTVDQTVLVLVRSGDNPYGVTSGFQGYEIPYQVVEVPQTGFTLPALNSSATQGLFGGIISLSELSYEYATGWGSGISVDQYNQIYAYQSAFGVRFVRIDAYPQPAFGTTTAAQGVGCCGTDVEQEISLTNSSGYPTANINTGATMSTANMYHYPAEITDLSTTWEIAKYGPDSNNQFTSDTTAAVINQFGAREQMVFFGSWATEWSPTSNFLQHAYIHWMTRGLFLGARKIYLGTQIDDVHLTTDVYYPQGNTFRLRPADLVAHVSWMKSINSRLPAGSNYIIELGHNGNGAIISATNRSEAEGVCNPDEAIYYDYPPDTPMEFQKPLGTGNNKWPTTPSSYVWSLACPKLDTLASWFMIAANRDAYAHVSHTFTHLPQNNITYSDANKEIVFNQAWLKQVGIAASSKFSAKSLIPPAITGLHNGDALRAWVTNGIVNAVGDNSRPVLLSPYNQHWPLISNVSNNGYAGVNIVPRWPTTIYFNCDTSDCTLKEWIDTSAGSGDFYNLLSFERRTTTRYLLGLRHDAYMFHQANLRQQDMPTITVAGQTGQLISLGQDALAQKFTDRMTRDNCNPKLSYTYSADGKSIVAVTVTANSNRCSAPIPVTFPGGAPTVSGSATSDKVGSEPLIMWASLQGSPVKFTLPTPVAI